MNPEQMVTVAEGVELCVQTVGDPARPRDPPHPRRLRLDGLVGGGAVRADRRRRSLRHPVRPARQRPLEHLPLGDPGYAMSDLATDAVGILDALGVERAHVVGRSMSGGTALFLALDHPERVASVTFMSTTTNDDGLPSPTADSAVATDVEAPDPSDTEAFVEYVDDDGPRLRRRVPPRRRGARPAPGPAGRRADPGPRGLA